MSQKDIHPLQQARKKLGITQRTLGDLTGLSEPTIKRAERCEPLYDYTISAICDYFSRRLGRRVDRQELGLQTRWESEESQHKEEELGLKRRQKSRIKPEDEETDDNEQSEEELRSGLDIPQIMPSSYPETATRFTAWGALLQANREEDAHQRVACDLLEVEIMAMTLHWKRSSGPIAILQQLTSETIRKHDTMHNDQSEHDTRITRRRALQAIALFPIQMYGLTLVADDLPHRLPLDEMLPCCASGMVACWELRQYEPEGLAAIERMLPAYLSTLEKLARQPSPFQAAAARLAAQGYLLITMLATHARRLDQMEAASLLARSYGRLAQDSNLEVAALIRLAIKFGFERRMVEAFNTYQEALTLPGFATASPLLQGHVYAALAGTGAFCQHSEALSFLSQAKDVYPTEPESDPSFTFALCGRDTLPLWEGLTLKRTGHHAKAVTAFSRFGSFTPVPGLLDYYRAEHLNYAASVAVEQRELDTACLYLDAAEEVAWNVHNKQRQAEVCETFRDIQLLWPREPKVKTMQEKIYARQH